jgi:hypothetical protein
LPLQCNAVTYMYVTLLVMESAVVVGQPTGISDANRTAGPAPLH